MPPLLDGIRFKKLVELAHTRFNANLKDAETKILRDSASSVDMPDPGENAERHEVRAAFIRWLATDPEAAQYIDPHGLLIYAATIPDNLDLEECRIAVRMVIRRCEFQGTIYLRSARTRGIFFFDSSLKGGISSDGSQIDGSLFLKGTQSFGEIRLLGAEIDGELKCSGSKLMVEKNALLADGARIHGDVFLNEVFESSGEIRFLGAEIEGTLNCSGAKLTTKGDALSADGARIHGGVFLNENFESVGGIRFSGAAIQGDLDCAGARIHSMNCLNMELEGDLIWYGLQNPELTDWADLSGVKVKNLRDDKESWPSQGKLNLDGLEYEELTLHKEPTEDELKNRHHPRELPLDADERIQWILRQENEQRREPQPWMQLRALLEKKGDHKGAKHVSFRFRCELADKNWCLLRWWKKFFAWIEENPFRICWTLGLTLCIGTSIFIHYGYQGAMMETVRYQPSAVSEDGEAKPVSRLYPPFQPFVYTLENTVPLIKLGMDEHWMPNAGAEFRRPWLPGIPRLDFLSTYGFLTFLRWALIVGGWTQATILAASLAERFKRD